MAIIKKDGYWHLDFRIGDENSKRFRRKFKTKGDAERFQRHTLTQYATGKSWEVTTDNRKLSELTALWYDLHGQHLKEGHRTLNIINKLAHELNDPIASKLTALDYMGLISKRTKAGYKAKTLNVQTGFLASVFNKLKALGAIDYPNPLANIDRLKVPDSTATFLSLPQIEELLEACRASGCPDLHLITLICLSTGARWSEAENLTRENCRGGLLTFTNTKSNKNRSVPISETLFNQLENHNPKSKKRIFGTRTDTSFSRAIKKTSIKLPAGQLTHICRHTFASHFMMKGGNILTLQKILGHSDIQMTMRYSHLAPDFLQDAVKLNPLA